jgi:hypothetical protein
MSSAAVKLQLIPRSAEQRKASEEKAEAVMNAYKLGVRTERERCMKLITGALRCMKLITGALQDDLEVVDKDVWDAVSKIRSGE